jgi:hypothetical protein
VTDIIGEDDDVLETTGVAPDTQEPATPTYKYYNDTFKEVHVVQALSIPDDVAALEYFDNVFGWFEEGHPDGRVKYVAVKRVGSDQYEMLAYEYNCDEQQVYTLGGQNVVEFEGPEDKDPEVINLPAEEPPASQGPVIHQHGMSLPHVHSEGDYATHQQPIEDEEQFPVPDFHTDGDENK